jgi:hypothetical protein
MANENIGNAWLEPESPAAADENQPKYPYNRVIQTQSGHSFEMDDTPTRERIRLQHRMGTFIEMHPNGDEVHKVYGDGYEITISNKNVLVEGTCSVTIKGDSIVNVEGNRYEKVSGNYELVVDGEMNFSSRKKAIFACDKDTIIAGGKEGGLGSGSVQFKSGDHIYISGDLTVGGEIIGDIITSKTRVDAGTGVSAGPLGFVSILGGLSIGMPAAIPGNINCIGLINAAISISAPLGNFVMMDATWMTDIINVGLHNAHFHVGFKGPTGPPIPRMI